MGPSGELAQRNAAFGEKWQRQRHCSLQRPYNDEGGPHGFSGSQGHVATPLSVAPARVAPAVSAATLPGPTAASNECLALNHSASRLRSLAADLAAACKE